MPCGTYTLLIRVRDQTRLAVGALGGITFRKGWYAYTGSAQGPGGLARVDRHRAVCRGDNPARHWHIDYLLAADPVSIDAVAVTPGADRECRIAAALPGDHVPGFGASDCGCGSHLTGVAERATLADALMEQHAQWQD